MTKQVDKFYCPNCGTEITDVSQEICTSCKIWKIEDEAKIEKKAFCQEDQIEFLKRFVRGEWVDCNIIQDLLGIDFSTGLRMFEFCRVVQWNPAPYNGQKVRTCFRIKLKKEDEE